mgnify:CR=1 FL=1
MFYDGLTDELAERVSGLLYDDSQDSVTHAATVVAGELGLAGAGDDSTATVMAKQDAVESLVGDILAGLKDGTISPRGKAPAVVEYTGDDTKDEREVWSEEEIAEQSKDAADTSDLEDGKGYEEGDEDWDPAVPDATDAMKAWL